MPRGIKLAQSAVALALLSCVLCPFVEMLLHWDNSIFLSGHDTESTLAFVLLLIELSFAIAKFLAVLLRAIFESLGIISSANCISFASPIFSEVPPVASPPIPLRI